jgi:two-component system, OmpR family, response regulator CpxR
MRKAFESASSTEVGANESEQVAKPMILLIDDDRELFGLMKDVFTRRGLQLAVAHDGEAGLSCVQNEHYDLVLLDVMLPKLDGLSVLTRIRQKSDIPVIMLTAKGAPSDRVAGLDAGADDYLPKPFGPDELLARIKAVLRRTQKHRLPLDQVVCVNGVRLDPGTRQIWFEASQIELTTIEYDILEILLRAAGRTVSRDELSLALYLRPAFPLDRSLDMHVSHLRKKLGGGGDFIRTVRGTGYLFCAEKNKE